MQSVSSVREDEKGCVVFCWRGRCGAKKREMLLVPWTEGKRAEKQNTALKNFRAVFRKVHKKSVFFLNFRKKALTASVFYGIISLAELEMNQ